MFVDPEKEKQLALQQEVKNSKPETEEPKMMYVNGEFVPIFSVAGSSKPTHNQDAIGRKTLLNQLKNQVNKKTADFDLTKLKNTFIARDLNSKRKDDDNVVVEDALAYEMEKGKDPEKSDLDDMLDDEDDQDFIPEVETEVNVKKKLYDDSENSYYE